MKKLQLKTDEERPYRLGKCLENLGWNVFGKVCENKKCLKKHSCIFDSAKFCSQCGSELSDDNIESVCRELNKALDYADKKTNKKPSKVY